MSRPEVDLPGPWQHRYVAANGARFHVAEAGEPRGPMVLFLHGFPQFWWAWRHQLPAFAEAGYRAVAMDLRGYGGSDKPPNGYDPVTLADDVAGVVKALGERDAILVGQGWGGYVAWATAVLRARQVRAVATVSAPHPLRVVAPTQLTRLPGLLTHLAAMQVPWLPERRISSATGAYLMRHLGGWSAPGSDFPDADTVATYRSALALWPAPHCALEYHRWLVRSRLLGSGRRFFAAMRQPVTQPAYTIFGGIDPALPAPESDRSGRYVTGRYRTDVVAGAGHFVPEEAPGHLTGLLLEWCDEVTHTPRY